MQMLLELYKEYPGFSFAVGITVAYASYYLLLVVKAPVLSGNNKLKQFLFENCPSLSEKIWPTWWCFQTHFQTVCRSFLQSVPPIHYDREIIKTPDGGQIGLDWVHNNRNNHLYPDEDTRPTVLILPGLTGSSGDSYIVHLALSTTKLGYRAVVFNNRGNGGVELLNPRTYCAANVEDLTLVVSHVKKRFAKAPVVGAGVSLGGLILFNYLAKMGRNSGLMAGFTGSMAWNVFDSFKTLEAGINRALNRYLATNLVESIKANERHFINLPWFNKEDVYRSKTIREFDESFTRRQFGYDSWMDYYKDACVHNKCDRVKVPLLALNAADDMFAPNHSIPTEEAEKSEFVTIAKTSYGGHIGFLEGARPGQTTYLDRVFSEYISAVFEKSGELSNLQ